MDRLAKNPDPLANTLKWRVGYKKADTSGNDDIEPDAEARFEHTSWLFSGCVKQNTKEIKA